MTYFRISLRKLVGLTLWLVVMLVSPAAFAQSRTAGQPKEEGISSYIFSPRAVTVVLVLILIVQLVYRHRVKNARPTLEMTYTPSPSPQPTQPTQPTQPATKKRYDRDEISKLLKASATSKNSGRSLEEAIRMSQEAQASLIQSMDGHVVVDENDQPVVEDETQSVEAEPTVETESSK